MHGLQNELLADQRLRTVPHLHGTQSAEISLQEKTSHGRHSVLGSLILDGDGHIVFCSKALADLIGTSPEELIGSTIKSLLPGMPVSPTTPGYNVAFAAFSCAAGHLHKWTLTLKDGSTVPVEASISSLKTGNQYIFCIGLHCPGEPGVALNELHPITSLTSPSRRTDKVQCIAAVEARVIQAPTEVPANNKIVRQFKPGFNSHLS